MDNRILLGIIAVLVIIVAFLLLQQPFAPAPLCGNNVCDPSEKESCPDDCVSPANGTKPNGTSPEGETPSGTCGDGKCDTRSETSQNCPQDCTGTKFLHAGGPVCSVGNFTMLCERYPDMYTGMNQIFPGDTPYRVNIPYNQNDDIKKFCVNGPILTFNVEWFRNRTNTITYHPAVIAIPHLAYIDAYIRDAEGELVRNAYIIPPAGTDQIFLKSDSTGQLFGSFSVSKPPFFPVGIDPSLSVYSGTVNISGIIRTYDESPLPYGQINIVSDNFLETDSDGKIRNSDLGSYRYASSETWFITGDCGDGTVRGRVVDTNGRPIPNAKILSLPYGYIAIFSNNNEPLSFGGETPIAVTDANGEFSAGMPSDFGHYALYATAEGYLPGPSSQFSVSTNQETNITITLAPVTSSIDTDLTQDYLTVRPVLITEIDARNDVYAELSPDAVFPVRYGGAGPADYPENVRPYLEYDEKSDYTGPYMQELLRRVRESIPAGQRGNETYVAEKTFEWAGYAKRDYSSDADASEGVGRGFADWAYSAEEIAFSRKAFCLEHERFVVALFRGMSIPARMVPITGHPTTQWWVQLPGGSGYWANFEGSRTAVLGIDHQFFENNSYLRASVPESELGYIPINGRDFIEPMDVDLKNPTIVNENSGFIRDYAYDKPDVKATLQNITLQIEKTGWSQLLEEWDREEKNAVYDHYYRAMGLSEIFSLANLGDQRVIEFWWPVYNGPRVKACNLDTLECKRSGEWDDSQKLGSYWTNHPEWFERDWIETECDSITGMCVKSYHVQMNLNNKCVSDSNCGADRICNANGRCAFVKLPAVCGNGACEARELKTCPQDCGGTAPADKSAPPNAGQASQAVCGDGICDGAAGEKETCPADCHQ